MKVLCSRAEQSQSLFLMAAGLLLTTVIIEPSFAQGCGSNADAPIATDRPQITNSSIVVPCGSLQLENGFEVSGNVSNAGIDLPETSLRYGILRKTEVRLALPNYFAANAASAGVGGGSGDIVLGLKQQLGPVHGFDVSIIPNISLPSGSDTRSSHGYDPGFQVPLSRALTKNWTAAGQLGLASPTTLTGRVITGQASVYFDRQITAPLDAYVEYSGAYPQQGGPQHLIDFGGALKVRHRQQLDFHCGFGLSSATTAYTVGLGYSVRLPAFRAS